MPVTEESTRLRELLEQLGLSQRGAARELGIDERTMRYYCAGDHPIPPVIWLALEALKARQSQPARRPE